MDLNDVVNYVNKNFYRRSVHRITSSGSQHKTLPVVLGSDGKLDRSLYDDADIGDVLSDATAKTTLADADTMPLNDSAASNALKKITWTNIKATLKTYLDTLYVALTGNQTIAGVKTFTSSIVVDTGSSATNPTFSSINDADVQSFFYTGRTGNAAISGKTVIENASNNAIILNPSAAGGPVGVGTYSPLADFHVNFATNKNIWLDDGGTGARSRIVAVDDAGTAAVPLLLQASEIILDTPEVAIGHAAPDSALHILGTNAQSGGITIESSAGTAADRLAIYPTGDFSTAFKSLANGDFQFMDSSGNAMFIVAPSTNDVYSITGNWGSSAVLTPTLGAFTTLTYTTQVARYHVLGNMVDFTFSITINACTTGTASGILRLELPYTCVNNTNEQWAGVLRAAGIATQYTVVVVGPNSFYATFQTNNGTTMQATELGAGDQLAGTLRYWMV